MGVDTKERKFHHRATEHTEEKYLGKKRDLRALCGSVVKLSPSNRHRGLSGRYFAKVDIRNQVSVLI
jgi:hypothetical protein